MRGLGGVCGAGRLFVQAALVVLSVAFSAAADDDEPPPPLRIVVFGDSQAAGLARGLQRVLVEDSRYRVLDRTHSGAALVHPEREWLDPVARFTAREAADIAVVMLGANDRLDMRDERGVYLHFGDDDWRQAYAARIDKILTLLTAAKLKVVWCGNPIARSATYTEDMAYINDIYAAEAARFGAQFVSLWTALADEQGHYEAYGKDRAGVTRRLRADDGIHFTAVGYDLIADKIISLFPAAAANTDAKPVVDGNVNANTDAHNTDGHNAAAQ